MLVNFGNYFKYMQSIREVDRYKRDVKHKFSLQIKVMHYLEIRGDISARMLALINYKSSLNKVIFFGINF